jgi:hypothetical protein
LRWAAILAGMLRFEETFSYGHRWIAVVLLFPTAVVLWLSIAHTIAFAFIFGIPVVMGWWSWAINRTHRVQIGDGQIVWDDSGLRSPWRKIVEISDIALIEMTRDEDGKPYPMYQMKDGKKIYLAINDQMRARDAIMEECPAIEIKPCK